MNIVEGLKLLQDGKKIYHKNSPHIIYHLIDKSLKLYQKFDEYDYYSFLTESRNYFTIDCKHDLEGWELMSKPVAIHFEIAKEFYKKGKTIKRIGLGKLYNNNDLTHIQFSIEDIEAHDWEVVED